MKHIIGLLFLFSIVACGDKSQKATVSSQDTGAKAFAKPEPKREQSVSPAYGFDSSYEITTDHQPSPMTGYFNDDNILDTAIFIRHKITGRDALFIKYGGTGQSFLLKSGKDVGGDFADFRWVGEYEIIRKGTKVLTNSMGSETTGVHQASHKQKITLQTDGLFIHPDEDGGGGIIYFKNGKYVWLPHDE